MAIFKCQACGNLHGAPVDTCGMCGSASVIPVDDQGQPFAATGNGPFSPPSSAAPSEAAFVEGLKAVFEEALEYVRSRDKERADRDLVLDNAETDRRDRITQAQAELLGQVTTLVDKLTELAESCVTYVDTLVRKASQPST